MIYNNIPQSKTSSNSDQTVKVFDQYFQSTIDLNNNELIAMTGFFESRGFDKESAESTALTILKQSKKDNYSSMQIMDTLGGLSNVEISGLVAEILNYNRFKTSSLGISQFYSPSDDVLRNILP
jgi:Glu-tRNA(Gln) amidotransferase subunit E-like FAD-binding protein